MVTASVEYEQYLANGWGFATFVDSGSAFDDSPDWRTGVGVGLRWKSPVGPLVVSNYTKTFPENPRGPDVLVTSPPRWPQQGIVPFHYPHPVTGETIG